MLRGWIANADAIMAHQGSSRRLTVSGQGRREKIPFSQDLVAHMKDVRREERVSIAWVPMVCKLV
jgi:hypothetical protein